MFLVFVLVTKYSNPKLYLSNQNILEKRRKVEKKKERNYLVGRDENRC